MVKKVTKKTTAKKPTAQKPTAKAKPKTKTVTAKPEILQAKLIPIKTKGILTNASLGTRRPANTPEMPLQSIEQVTNILTEAKYVLEQYAAHLRSLDRKRLNSIGTKREGFAQRAYRIAMDSPEFLPNYLSMTEYTNDYDQYTAMQTIAVLDK